MSNAQDRGEVNPLPSEDVRQKLRQRNWRELRESLVRLDSNDRIAIADWLTAVGYVPERVLGFKNDQAVIVDKNSAISWGVSDVTDSIARWIHSNSKVVSWLMKLDDNDFELARDRGDRYFVDLRPYSDEDMSAEEHEAIEHQAKELEYVLKHRSYPPQTEESALADRKYGEVIGGLINRSGQDRPARLAQFLRDIQAPSDIDLEVLKVYLTKTITGLNNLKGVLRIEADGVPLLHIHADTPIVAIAASVGLDRAFSARRLAACRNCGNSFEQKKSSDVFCSDRCRNYWTTTERRNKIQALLDTEKVWSEMPVNKRKGHDRWKWIAEHASQSLETHLEIDPAWAKREVEKAHQKKAQK